MIDLLRQHIAAGLKRKSITKASQWAENYRVMPAPFNGNWSFKYFPWLREMHDSQAEENVGMKAAQIGYTETMLNIAFFWMDIKGLNVLYLLPAADPDASDFSSRAFDPALELSPYLDKMFSNVRNVGHKRAGSANLFVRGTKSRTGLKSIPAALLIFDELEEMVQENLALAEERTGGQLEYQKWKISTPRIEDYGIHLAYKNTSQEHFFFACPKCNRKIELLFPDCIVIDEKNPEGSYYVCPKCKGKLDHELKFDYLSSGLWVPSVTDRIFRGFSINRMYSSAKAGQASKFAEKYVKAQLDPWEEQELFNSWLGLPHVVKGGQISDQDIVNMVKGYKSGTYHENRILTMGVDVGTFFHYEITEYVVREGITTDVNVNASANVVKAGKVKTPEELDKLMEEFPIMMCVMDANPERRTALNFANRHWGRVKLCFYGRGINGKQMKLAPDDADEPTITVDRTSWLDVSLGRIKNGTINYPSDTELETKNHLKALVRIYEKDSDGNPTSKYVNGNKPDHAAHARNYSEMALPLAFSMATSQDIQEVL